MANLYVVHNIVTRLNYVMSYRMKSYSFAMRYFIAILSMVEQDLNTQTPSQCIKDFRFNDAHRATVPCCLFAFIVLLAPLLLRPVKYNNVTFLYGKLYPYDFDNSFWIKLTPPTDSMLRIWLLGLEVLNISINFYRRRILKDWLQKLLEITSFKFSEELNSVTKIM